MRKVILVVAILAAIAAAAFCLAAPPAHAQGLTALSDEVAALVERASPSVVSISKVGPPVATSTGGPGAGEEERREGRGGPPALGEATGFVVEGGYVLTSARMMLVPGGMGGGPPTSPGAPTTSVVGAAVGVEVVIGVERRRVPAEVVGVDRPTDVAVLKVDWSKVEGGAPPPLPFSISETVRPGSFVIVIGNRGGLHNSVSVGTVAGIGRSLDTGGAGLLQIDAVFSPGLAGAPVLSVNGEVVGMVTSMYAGVAMPFMGQPRGPQPMPQPQVSLLSHEQAQAQLAAALAAQAQQAAGAAAAEQVEQSAEIVRETAEALSGQQADEGEKPQGRSEGTVTQYGVRTVVAEDGEKARQALAEAAEALANAIKELNARIEQGAAGAEGLKQAVTALAEAQEKVAKAREEMEKERAAAGVATPFWSFFRQGPVRPGQQPPTVLPEQPGFAPPGGGFFPGGGMFGYSNSGFAVPVSEIKWVFPQLRDKGKVSRAFLGIRMGVPQAPPDSAQALEMPKGALVTRVFENSPAAQAGILKGDIIVKFAGEDVTTPVALRAKVIHLVPGEQVQVLLWRPDTKQYVPVTVMLAESRRFE